MKVYLAGPMRGYAAFNFPLFDEVALALRGMGYEVVSPADHDRAVLAERHAKGITPYSNVEDVPGYHNGDLRVYESSLGAVYDLLGWDFTQIVAADGIVMLPKWEKSSGSTAERFVAEMTDKTVLLAWKYNAEDGWAIQPDIEQKRMVVVVRDYAGQSMVEPVTTLA